MVYTAERFIEKHGNFLSSEEISNTQSYVEALRQALAKAEKDEILKNADDLNEFTRPFAERVMDVAVSAAMKGKSIDK